MVDNIGSIFNDKDGTSTPVQRHNWSELGVHNYVKMAIVGGLLWYLFRGEIHSVVGKWSSPSWSHGFLIPLFSLYFLHQQREKLLNVRVRPSYLGLILMIAVIALHILNKLSPSGYGYFSQIAVIGALGTAVLFLGGWAVVRCTWLPVLFLVFAVPLPDGYYFKLTFPMRVLAANVAATLLGLVNGLVATVNGVVISIVYNGEHLKPDLNVAEACSGMRLLMAFVALGVAMAYLHYRPIWQRLVLLGTTIPIAIFCNIVRVTVTGFIYVLIDPYYTRGLYHDILGLLMLPLAFGLYGILAWFMGALFVEESRAAVPDIVVRAEKA
jgi:exosortase